MRLREVHATYRTVAGAPSGPRPVILTLVDAANVVAALLAERCVEHFGVLCLDTKHRPIAWDVVSVGTLDSTLVHPRDVFRTAILHNAAAIIVAHNHPSGDATPSRDDLIVTEQLMKAGDVMGIKVLDSLVIGEYGTYRSAKPTALAA